MVIGQMVAIRAETFAIVHLISMLAGPCALLILLLAEMRAVHRVVAYVTKVGVVDAVSSATS